MAPDSLGIASRFVLSGDEPVRLVIHHGGGTWDFLCNTTGASADLVTIHAAHMFDRFTDLAEVADLPKGYLAEREEPGDRWHRELDLGLGLGEVMFPATPACGNWHYR